MTDLQLYILVAIPLVAIAANTALLVLLFSQLGKTNDRIDALRADVHAQIESLRGEMAAKFDVLTGK